MKTARDPRHLHRIKLVQMLFSWQFRTEKKAFKDLQPITDNLEKIDATIIKAAPLWPIKQINRIDLAILRLSIFELLLDKEPKKVIIDEAVELAKKFGSDKSPSFVNGVLGKVV